MRKTQKMTNLKTSNPHSRASLKINNCDASTHEWDCVVGVGVAKIIPREWLRSRKAGLQLEPFEGRETDIEMAPTCSWRPYGAVRLTKAA
jgi:hypothetical protein